MFNLFRRKPQGPPSFDTLEASSLKDKYFIRCAQWGFYQPGKIHVADPNAPAMHTMDDWPQTVFLEATGQRTVKEFVHWMASQYKNRVPKKLAETILGTIQQLLDAGLIRLEEEARELPYYHDGPMESLDQKKVIRLMKEDGLIGDDVGEG